MCAAAHELLCAFRRFQRGLKRKPLALIKKLRKAKREAASGEKPEPVRTHLRNMIIVPEMIGSIIGVYNGKTFNQVSPASPEPSHHSQQALQTFLSPGIARTSVNACHPIGIAQACHAAVLHPCGVRARSTA